MKTEKTSMKDQMIRKVTGSLLTCALLLGTTSLQAADGACGPSGCPMPRTCSPCEQQCCDWGTIYGTVGALYFRAGDCATRYAVEGGSDVPQALNAGTYAKINEQYIKPGANWGVRAQAGIDKEWIGLWGAYVWWENTDSATAIRGPAATNFLIVPGATGDWLRVRAQQKTTYQTAHLTVTMPVCTTCGLTGAFMVEGRYVDIEQTTHLQAARPSINGAARIDNVGRGLAKNSFRGGGVGFGTSFDGPLPLEGTIIAGSAMLMGIIGESGQAVSQFRIVPLANAATPGQDLTLRHRSQSYFVPAFEAQMGFGYERTCGCVHLRLKVMWEWHFYFNALFDAPNEDFTARGFAQPLTNTAPNLPRDSAFKSLNIGGPSINIGASF